ncbi:hypothetical protein TNIN_96151 [Trichonephila inaurata madagascariensis]|uniref:Uncharacterized protein n=1 Tax=Trichonephila inaurata madagascariensis TaxID=2747483 RepID=A0A8X6XPB6_9ARAC|nr:hypothetical protein TNIN_96151 [Trichonephila inaurata madagascariensis]
MFKNRRWTIEGTVELYRVNTQSLLHSSPELDSFPYGIHFREIFDNSSTHTALSVRSLLIEKGPCSYAFTQPNLLRATFLIPRRKKRH